jgi:hypothetical protein
VVKIVSTRFWDAYLGNSESARHDLRSDRMREDSEGRFTFERR